MYALKACIDKDIEDLTWQRYVADCIGSLTQRVYRFTGAEGFTIPVYSELLDPSVSKKDVRTAEEIKNDIVKRLSA